MEGALGIAGVALSAGGQDQNRGVAWEAPTPVITAAVEGTSYIDGTDFNHFQGDGIIEWKAVGWLPLTATAWTNTRITLSTTVPAPPAKVRVTTHWGKVSNEYDTTPP